MTSLGEFPAAGMAFTHILVVSDLMRSRQFYTEILGATVYREYGGTSCVLTFLDNWLLLVTGGGPTPDKPTVTFTAPQEPDLISHAMTIRVPDCYGAHAVLSARGAQFLAPPVEWESEIRAFFRDPDGHLFEISQVR
jgi:catechol 2,3-dioxygenase-like lactoylglutathione lyase family enzyme